MKLMIAGSCTDTWRVFTLLDGVHRNWGLTALIFDRQQPISELANCWASLNRVASVAFVSGAERLDALVTAHEMIARTRPDVFLVLCSNPDVQPLLDKAAQFELATAVLEDN